MNNVVLTNLGEGEIADEDIWAGIKKELNLRKETGINNSHLYIKFLEKKGFGVFTNQKINKNDIIELCHCVSVPLRSKLIRVPQLQRYSYWDNCNCERCTIEGSMPRIAFGFGSIYNSAEKRNDSNVFYVMCTDENMLAFVAKRDIEPDEELIAFHGEGYFNSWCKDEEIVDTSANEKV